MPGPYAVRIRTPDGWQDIAMSGRSLEVYEQVAEPPVSAMLGAIWINTAAPDPAPPLVVANPIVSALPGSGTDQQIINYQNAAMATDGVVWQFRYRAGSASAYKWEFVGGSSWGRERMQSDTAAFIGSGWGAFNANDPVITVPLAGEYRCEHSATFYPTAAGAGSYGIGLRVGATDPASFNEFASQYISANNQSGSVEQKRTVTATLGQAIAQIYYGGGFSSNGDLRSRSLRVTPVRVG